MGAGKERGLGKRAKRKQPPVDPDKFLDPMRADITKMNQEWERAKKSAAKKLKKMQNMRSDN